MTNQRYSFTQKSALLQLLISSPDESDSGEYTCRIEQPGQPSKSISHNVNVPEKKVPVSETQRQAKRGLPEQRESLDAENKPISLETFMKNLTIEEGNRAKFICSVIGHIQSINWFKDNKPLSIDTDHRYKLTHSDGLVGLEIHDVMPNDSGFYTCTIRGRRNSVTSSSKLTVYESYSRRPKIDRPSIPAQSHESISKGIKRKIRVSRSVRFVLINYFFPSDTIDYRPPSIDHFKSSVARERSPIRREFTRPRDIRPIISDYQSKSYRSRLSPVPPYRSRSYQSDLNRLTPAPSTLSIPSREFTKTDRSRSYSALSVNLTSINAYSRHYNHHNFVPRIPSTWQSLTPSIDSVARSKMNSRSRFRSRSTLKSYRSRSANPPDDGDNFSLRSSMAHITTLSDIHSMRFSKSLSDLRATYSRINYSSDKAHSLLRDSYASRNNTENYILKPDIYVRWLKNKRDMEHNAFSKDFPQYSHHFYSNVGSARDTDLNSNDFQKYSHRYDSNASSRRDKEPNAFSSDFTKYRSDRSYADKSAYNDHMTTHISKSARASSCSKLYAKNLSSPYSSRFTFGSEKYPMSPRFLEPMRGKLNLNSNLFLVFFSLSLNKFSTGNSFVLFV